MKKIIGIEDFDTIKVTKMTAMFEECNELKELNLFYFNTYKVEDMSYMFRNCYNLKEIKGIDNFTNDESTNIECLFDGCEKLDFLNDNEELKSESDDKISKNLDMNNKMNLKNKKSFVTFISREYKINLVIFYEDYDIFSKLEEELYLRYPDLKNKNITFIVNGNEINRTSTMIENNIKNGYYIFIKI